jgi:hypothetical protein
VEDRQPAAGFTATAGCKPLAERSALYLWNEAEQEHNARMEANRRYEEAMKVAITGKEEFDQSLSSADALILHAMGVEVCSQSGLRHDRSNADVVTSHEELATPCPEVLNRHEEL